MDDFERIKTLTADAIKANQPNARIMRQWKYDIRNCLMRIRVRFNENIDKFI